MPNKKSARRRWVPIVARTALGLAILGGSIGLYQGLKATRAQPKASAEGQLPPLVRTGPVVEAPIARPWEGYGTVRAMARATVSTEVRGRVVRRPEAVEPGMPVRKGDLLLALEDFDYQRAVEARAAQVRATEADLRQLDVEAASLDEQLTLAMQEVEVARRDYERAVDVRERAGTSPTEVDQRLSALRRAERDLAALEQRSAVIDPRREALRAALASQRADLQRAQRELERTRVTAPIDGVIERVDLDEGDLAAAGSPAAVIVDLRRLEAPITLPVSAADSVEVGDQATIATGPSGEATWSGRISRLAPVADENTRSLTAYVELTQQLEVDGQGRVRAASGKLLRPGQFVVCTVAPPDAPLRLAVPRRAVVDGAVLVAQANSSPIARRVPVRTLFSLEGDLAGAGGERQWLVVRGALRGGEEVIVSDPGSLRDGQAIRIGQPGEATASGGGA